VSWWTPIAALTIGALFLFAVAQGATVDGTTFEELSLLAESAWDGVDTTYNNGSGDYNTFRSGAATFNNYHEWYYSTYFGSAVHYWDSWAYSNRSDISSTGVNGQYTAMGSGITGQNGAEDSANYGVAYFGYYSTPTMTFDEPGLVDGAYFTNNAYAYDSVLNGNSFAKKFGGATGNDEDWFRLTIEGMYESSSTGAVEFYLADYRFSDNELDYIVDDWTWVDLSSLGTVDSLQFSLVSSDIGPYGINTPTYFAMDYGALPSDILQIENVVGTLQQNNSLRAIHGPGELSTDGLDSYDTAVSSFQANSSGLYTEVEATKLMEDARPSSSTSAYQMKLYFNGTLTGSETNQLQLSFPDPLHTFQDKAYLTLRETDASGTTTYNAWDVHNVIANWGGTIGLGDLPAGTYDENTPYGHFQLDFDPFLFGDTDFDGDVDTGDLTTMYQNYNGATGSGKNMSNGDTDYDGDVDTGDLTTMYQNYTGATAPDLGAGSPSVADLIYDAATGVLTIDPDGVSNIISYVLQTNESPRFLEENHNAAGGLWNQFVDSTDSQIGATIGLFGESPINSPVSIGAVMPAGLSEAEFLAFLSSTDWAIVGGGGAFDLVYQAVPEPSAIVLIFCGGLTLLLPQWYRRRHADR
jgi:hypothetical protein